MLREREVTPGDWAVVCVVALLALVLAWQAVEPLRAARTSFAGDAALGVGNGTSALADFQRAADLDSHTSLYLTKEGDLYNRIQAQQPTAGVAGKSLEAYEGAARRDPFDLGALRTSGRLADAAKDYAKAERYFRRAASLDPDNSATILDLTQFQLRHGQAAEARRRLEALAALLPKDGGLQATLGDARAVTGDTSGARTAYQVALALSPDPASDPNKIATAGLAKLGD